MYMYIYTYIYAYIYKYIYTYMCMYYIYREGVVRVHCWRAAWLTYYDNFSFILSIEDR